MANTTLEQLYWCRTVTMEGTPDSPDYHPTYGERKLRTRSEIVAEDARLRAATCGRTALIPCVERVTLHPEYPQPLGYYGEEGRSRNRQRAASRRKTHARRS